MSRVVVVGSVNVDRVVRLDVLPAAGETAMAKDVDSGFGGKGGNQASAAAAAGALVSLVAAVGDDDEGRASLEDLRGRAVDTTSVVVVPGTATGTAHVFVDDEGENFIVIESGANAALDAEVVTRALRGLALSGTDVLLTSGEIGDEVLAASAQEARSVRALHVHNAAPYREIGPWSRSDRVLIVVNEVESMQATSSADVEQAAAMLADGRYGAVVTRGARGALLSAGGRSWSLPAPSVPVVDSTGAGDAFCGTLAACLATGAELVDAVRRSVDAGAEAVTRPGARSAETGTRSAGTGTREEPR